MSLGFWLWQLTGGGALHSGKRLMGWVAGGVSSPEKKLRVPVKHVKLRNHMRNTQGDVKKEILYAKLG